MATILAKTPTDKCIILARRQALVYPFAAPDWTDIRLGMFLSLTQNGADDDTSGLGETLAKSSYADRCFLGFRNNSDTLPATAGTSFFGVLNENSVSFVTDSSVLVGADSTSTFTGTKFWRLMGSPGGVGCANSLINGTAINQDSSYGDKSLLFPQDVIAAGGYCLLVMLRLTRTSGIATSIKFNELVPTANLSYSSAPTISAIRDSLRTVDFGFLRGPSAIAPMLDAVYLYWPFFNSRLRIHALVLEKFA